MVGFWFARQPRVAAVFDPYVKMANALPRVVLAPIFTLWLGLGIWSKVALGVTLVFFIVFFNVYQGVKEVSTTVLDNGRMLGMSERQLMRHVYWPSALSWMFSSLHTSVGFAVVGAVVGEYLGSAAGLGYLIQQAEGVFDVAGVFAGMFVLSAFVILIDIAVTMVERRLLVWRPVAAQEFDCPSLRGREARPIRLPMHCQSRPGIGMHSSHADGCNGVTTFSIRARCSIVRREWALGENHANDFEQACRDAAGAGADVRSGGSAEQDHDRGRGRRLPVLSADRAGQAAWRIRARPALPSNWSI